MSSYIMRKVLEKLKKMTVISLEATSLKETEYITNKLCKMEGGN